MTVLLFVAGLLLLVVGAEGLVRGASRLAAVFGISPLIIGLTVVTMIVLALREVRNRPV
jgi:cation:H+ antiporter